ncbi:Ig-like domain-containing protein [Rhodococcus tukisamuensis]|uniref:Ig-like domain (Group 3) n=1 Tax=Rhodococcus tukisamuensis TaxID=168276 RepID=A0A1G6W5R8_9NOCA|nr:Ig-like domain-containing protein [Rhodococcus tukisamuensis]SDD61138.1 Ig-like domain (group 3) [Rhodococcus tukisamuensis]
MAHRATTRGAAAGAATTLAIGALALLGAGIAGAAPASSTWEDSGSRFTRTVSNATPAVGETITVTTKFERPNASDETINVVKDHHDACLTYVFDSAKMNGNAVEPYLEIKPDFIAGDFMATSYGVTVTKTASATLTAQYKVGADCALGTALNSGMSYLSNLGAANFAGKGPAITVSANISTTTTLDPVTGAKVGAASTLKAKVNPAAAGGTITFKDGTTVIGTGQVGADGTATVAWTPATAGQRTLTADFSGRAGASGSTTTATVTVAPADGTNPGGTGSLGSLLGGFGS